MELKPGYKQTELGILPADWEVGDLSELDPFVTSGSRGWAKYYSDRGLPFVRITNLSRDSIYLDLSDLRYVKLPENESEGVRTQLNDGDLLVSITADIGIIGYVDETVPKPAFINQHIALVRLAPNRVHSKFLSYFLAGEIPQRMFRAGTDQGAKAGMSLSGVRRIAAAFPSLTEQQSIATALSDVDALISSLDQLIAKKRDIKQATMQQLLTGKQRLPGFSGEWEYKSLSKVVNSLEAGVSVNSTDDDPGTGDHCILKTSAVSNGEFLANECKKIISRDISRARCSPLADTILISRMNTPDLVGEVGYVDKDYPNLFLPDRLWMTCFRQGAEVAARWLAYLLSSEEYKRKLKTAATGTSGSMKNIAKDVLLALPIHFPSIAEQTAIASVLSDMDAEIAALEQKRDKTRATKQGMMQELLTGRIRLV